MAGYIGRQTVKRVADAFPVGVYGFRQMNRLAAKYAARPDKHDIFDDSSIVATYQFDSDATDLGGNYDGTWSGTEQYTTGQFGQAADFDGASEISLPNGMFTLGDISFSFWYYPDATETSVTLINLNYNILFQCKFDRNGNDDLSIWSNTWTDFSIALTRSAWNHIVFTYNSTSNDWENYINVINIDSDTNILDSGDSSTGNFLGNNEAEGSFDQFRVFNKILTSNEVEVLYTEKRIDRQWPYYDGAEYTL